MNQDDPENWKTLQFRQQMRSRLEAELKSCPNALSKNINEIENSLSNTSTTKEEYFNNFNKLLK